MTFWYEIYYDIWLGGTYYQKIDEMHKKYGIYSTLFTFQFTDVKISGPIVRINPYEVHLNDPDFIDSVFPGPGRQTDKYFFTGRRTGSKNQRCFT